MSEEVKEKKEKKVRIKPFQSLRLLYVEDEEMARMGLAGSLRRYVGEVYEAEDGAVGLQTFKEKKPDLVITDINMPNMNGLEMIREIKMIDSHVPIVITSAYNDTTHLLEAINAGVDQFLIKPVEFKKLFEILEKNAEILLAKMAVEHSNKLQAEYKNAVDASAILSISDMEGNITYANDKLTEISGYSKEEMIGKNHRILKHPDNNPEVFVDMWKTITAKKIWRGRVKNQKKGGGHYYVDSTIIPILDENDKIVEYLGIRYDVTNLIEAQTIAENASKAKSEFLANMSHEIRTPMNGVIGFLDVLAETRLDTQQQEYISIIKSSANHLMEIINDILDLSKIESGKLRVESHPFRSKKEFEHCLQLFVARAKEKQIALELHMDSEIPVAVKGDSVRIRQVLANLISNAIKFTPENGRVDVKITHEGGDAKTSHIRFAVRDTGIGIPKEKQAAIFTPFEQADVSTTRKFGGTGLGLSISVSLVEMMGGKLQLQSEENEGSEFYFTLPMVIVDESELEENDGGVDSQVLCFDASVLVAEDNPINQKLIRILLEDLGLKVDIAPNGQEALEAYREKTYQMIFMDINMPVLDGLQATRQIIAYEKEQGKPHTPIIALTANALQGDRERFLEAGMDEYLTKPVEKPKLIEMLGQYLEAGTKEPKAHTPTEEQSDKPQISSEPSHDAPGKEHVQKLVEILGINETIVKMLLEEFFSTIDADVESLGNAIAQGEIDQIRSISHSIKGSSANLRLEAVSHIAALMQKAVDDGEAADFGAMHEELKNEVVSARNVL